MRDGPHRGTRSSDRIVGVVQTHWVLAICSVCHHEIPRAENGRSSCPGCGAPLDLFPLFRRVAAAPAADQPSTQ